MSDTIEQLKDRVKQYPPVACETNLTTLPPPPVSDSDYADFERDNGLILPGFVRRLYTEVANGGYGPAYGVNRLDGGDDSIARWNQMFRNANRDEPSGPQWPSHLIRFCEIGCNMFYALDINVVDTPVFHVEPNEFDDISKWMQLVDSSVDNWLNTWASAPVPASNLGNNSPDNKAMDTKPRRGQNW